MEEAVKMKEVTFTTPVLCMPWILREEELNFKVTYKKNSNLHDQYVPPEVAKIPHTMVIDLPIDDIESYVADNLSWLPLKKDSELLTRLTTHLSLHNHKLRTGRALDMS